MSTGRIGLSELAVGVPFPLAGLEIARHALGVSARRAILRAETFDPHEALGLGLIDEHVSPEALHERATAVAARLGSPSPEAYALVKRQLHRHVAEAIGARTEEDEAVAAIWAADETRERIDRQLAALSRRRRGDPPAERE
jgi:enoyl-CoA hydratase